MCYVLLSFLRPGELHMGPGKYIKSQKNPNGPFPTCLGSPNFHLPLLWTVSGKCDKEKKPPWRAPHGPKVHTAALQQVSKPAWFFFKNIVIWQYFLKRIHPISHVSKGLKPTMIFTINPAPLERQFSLFFFPILSVIVRAHTWKKRKRVPCGFQPPSPLLPGEPLRTSCHPLDREWSWTHLRVFGELRTGPNTT